MRRILALALLTFKEGIRDRALIGITVIAIIMLLANILITNLFGHELGKVIVDLNLSTIAFSGLLLIFFVNINLMSKDIDKRTIYCVLAKPISRNEYIWGKYLGLMLLVFVAITLLTIVSAGLALFAKASTPAYYFRDFSWQCYFQAYLYELMMFFILNAVVIFFSSITTSSFLTLLFSVATYITGQTIEEVLQFFKKEAVQNGISSPLNETFIGIIQYVFPNFSAFDIKILASHGKLISADHTYAIMGYAIIYTLVLLFFSSLIFSRREFN